MGRWEDESMGRGINEIIRNRDNERMGRGENGKILPNFI
jgi:hypothetical protein